MKRFLSVAVVVFFGLSTAFAQYSPDRYNDRRGGPRYHDDYDYGRGRGNVDALQREARESINRGIRSGQLSRRESHMLMKQYDRIAHQERKFSSHGRLSGREVRILTADLDRLIAETHRLSGRRGDGRYGNGHHGDGRHGDGYARGYRDR